MPDSQLLESMSLKRAKEQMLTLRQRDTVARQFMHDMGMNESLRTLEQINPTYVYERLDQLIDQAAGGARPDSGEIGRVQEMYRQLMDQFTGLKFNFDEELIQKGADRKFITEILISSATKSKDVTPNQAWRQSKLGQTQEHTYALISETGQQAGLVARVLDMLRQPPGQSSAAAASIH